MTLRDFLNKLLAIKGYKIQKIDRFKELLDCEYKNTDNFCFIQIGANDGVKFDDLFTFVVKRKVRGLVIEPLKHYFTKLNSVYSAFPAITAINCAVHSSEKYVKLYHVDPKIIGTLPEWSQGIGSIDPEHHKKSGISTDHIITEEVEAKHLMSIIGENKLTHVNLLQIDAEGYDGEVIKMIDFQRIKPSIIKYEHRNLIEADKEGVEALLKTNGYQLLHIKADTIAVLI